MLGSQRDVGTSYTSSHVTLDKAPSRVLASLSPLMEAHPLIPQDCTEESINKCCDTPHSPPFAAAPSLSSF